MGIRRCVVEVEWFAPPLPARSSTDSHLKLGRILTYRELTSIEDLNFRLLGSLSWVESVSWYELTSGKNCVDTLSNCRYLSGWLIPRHS